MTALTQDRPTPERDGRSVHDALATSAVIFAGAMYMLDSGEAVPAAAQSGATALVVRAVALKRADEGQGDTHVRGRQGVWQFENSTSTDEISAADIGAPCYAADDCTVAKTSDSDKRPLAGTVFDVDERGVWVRIG